MRPRRCRHQHQTERGEWFCVVDPVRGSGEPIVVYPAPKQTEVPAIFAGGPEVPEPTAAGFPISVSVPPAQTGDGRPHRTARPAGQRARRLAVDAGKASAARLQNSTPSRLIPKEPLQGDALYHVKASAQIDGKPWSLAWSFTTEEDSDTKGDLGEEGARQGQRLPVLAGLKPVVLDDALIALVLEACALSRHQ